MRPREQRRGLEINPQQQGAVPGCAENGIKLPLLSLVSGLAGVVINGLPNQMGGSQLLHAPRAVLWGQHVFVSNNLGSHARVRSFPRQLLPSAASPRVMRTCQAQRDTMHTMQVVTGQVNIAPPCDTAMRQAKRRVACGVTLEDLAPVMHVAETWEEPGTNGVIVRNSRCVPRIEVF